MYTGQLRLHHCQNGSLYLRCPGQPENQEGPEQEDHHLHLLKLIEMSLINKKKTIGEMNGTAGDLINNYENVFDLILTRE